MKTTILRLCCLLTAIIGMATTAKAQSDEHADSIYICHANGKVDGYALDETDSVAFEKTSLTVPERQGEWKGVDLGLSVMWADMNVGADSPEKSGGYYAYGETAEKSSYTKATYEFYKNGSFQFIGTDFSNSYGYYKNISGTGYDVARTTYGGKWRLPTLDEYRELQNDCSWTWTTQKGVNGYRVTGKNGNSIFLPATGCKSGKNLQGYGTEGQYWSAYSDKDDKEYGRGLYFISSISYYDVHYYIQREKGASARAVCSPNATQKDDGIMYVCQKDGNEIRYKLADIDSIAFKNPKTQAIRYEDLMAVDLGLSVKWASKNVGAENPERSGGYYAWGETQEKTCYDENSYEHQLKTFYLDIGTDISGTEYDVAHTTMGGNWRMPTIKEYNELINKCSWTWTTRNGIAGYKVTGKNGNFIFLPATGIKEAYSTYFTGRSGFYWSSSYDKDYQPRSKAQNLGFGKSDYKTSGYTCDRFCGQNVRAVCP